MILIHMRNHSNILSLVDLILPPSVDEFEDVYIVTELMEWDLRTLIRSNNEEFSDENIRYFMYNLLRGVKYIHSANIVHRDLKPANILLNREFDVKICDFGLSTSINDNDPSMSTTYVATRWYRGK
jgi:serine/threonine protein kinase